MYEYCNFTYDGYGRRLSKSYSYDPNPGSTSDYSYTYTTTYDYDTSGRLIHETCVETTTYTGGSSSTKEITYLYDETGIVGAVQKVGSTETTFYFDKNIKGDVIGIYNSSGTKIANYSYDAWGNCTTKTLVANSFIAYNPIRYRGYYYDRETRLYYLNARYYDPSWRRFISPDHVSSLNPSAANGLNLYSYANNNPVNSQYDLSFSNTINSCGETSNSIRLSENSGRTFHNGTFINISDVISALGALSTAFSVFDQFSGWLSSGLEAGLSCLGSKGFGIQFGKGFSGALSKFGVGMIIIGSTLSWASSVYNNFNNPMYTTEEVIAASAMDAVYYGVKGYATYWLGNRIGALAVKGGVAAGCAVLGATIFGTTIGVVGAVAIGVGVAFAIAFAGAVAIYFLSEGADLLYERLKTEIFE